MLKGYMSLYLYNECINVYGSTYLYGRCGCCVVRDKIRNEQRQLRKFVYEEKKSLRKFSEVTKTRFYIFLSKIIIISYIIVW